MIEQFNNIYEIMERFKTEQDCIDHLTQLRWNGNVVSPFDETSKVYVCKRNRYKCKNTGKYFNVKTDTIFDDTKIPLQKWFMALFLEINEPNISSYMLCEQIGITQKTAWYIQKRIRYAKKTKAFKSTISNIALNNNFFNATPAPHSPQPKQIH